MPPLLPTLLAELPRPLYQPIEYPGYADAAAVQPCVERWEMIKASLPAKPGTVVDYGCHTGWFCRQFARAGWLPIGIDKSAYHIEIATAMTNWCGVRGAQYACDDIITTKIMPPMDVALCLSVSMYLFGDVAAGWSFYDRLSSRAQMLYLDFGGMYANRLPFATDTVVEQFKKNTKYKKGKLIGRTGFESRPFFLFER